MSDSSTRSITIRLDADLFQAIKEVAAGNSRSMNAEISARLATSLNQDAWWIKDSAWPTQDKSEQSRPSHAERVEQLHQRMSIIMKEWRALSDGLAGLPDVMKGTIIRRLSELEQERAKLDSELRLIDPDYQDNH